MYLVDLLRNFCLLDLRPVQSSRWLRRAATALMARDPCAELATSRVHMRRWLRGIVSSHSPVWAPPHADGEPLLISAAWDEASTLPPPTDLPLDSIETLSQPWARQSIEGWYRAHSDAGDESPLPTMDEERFLTFGKQATSLSELELLDLLDLFDRESVGEIGFNDFIVVIGFLLVCVLRLPHPHPHHPTTHTPTTHTHARFTV